MKTLKLIAFCIIIFLSYNVNAQYFTTEHDSDFNKLLPKAQKDKLNEKKLAVFSNSYHQANEEDYKRIIELKQSGQADIWIEIYFRTQNIKNRQKQVENLSEEIKKQINFKELNLDSEINNSKEKAELYICAKVDVLLKDINEKNIKVVRRLTGGGAVFHDFGNLNFTFIDNQGQGDFRTFTQPILELLRSLGVDARFEGRNDLMIDGQKFSGNAQCKQGKRVMHHGTLLFSTEMTDLSEALKVNPLKFVDKAVKSVRKRVTNISSHLPKPLSVDQFADLLMNYILQTRSNSYLQPFTPEEIDPPHCVYAPQ